MYNEPELGAIDLLCVGTFTGGARLHALLPTRAPKKRTHFHSCNLDLEDCKIARLANPTVHALRQVNCRLRRGRRWRWRIAGRPQRRCSFVLHELMISRCDRSGTEPVRAAGGSAAGWHAAESAEHERAVDVPLAAGPAF